MIINNHKLEEKNTEREVSCCFPKQISTILINPFKSHFVKVFHFLYSNLEDVLKRTFISSTQKQFLDIFSAGASKVLTEEFLLIFQAVNFYLSGQCTSSSSQLPQHLPRSLQEPLSHAGLSRDTRESLYWDHQGVQHTVDFIGILSMDPAES